MTASSCCYEEMITEEASACTRRLPLDPERRPVTPAAGSAERAGLAEGSARVENHPLPAATTRIQIC